MLDQDDSTAVQIERPSESTIIRHWNRFHADPLLSAAQLKQYALTGIIDERGLRSLHWRHYFGLLPSPSHPNTSSWSAYKVSLEHARSDYEQFRTRFLTSPDGSWVNDGADSTSHSPRLNGAISSKPAEVQVNNPLGLDSANPWSSWFSDLELRRTIRQDVQRTFPEIDYFRDPSVQDRMVDLLFIWCKLEPEIGYRQGMHELLATLLWTVDYDSLAPQSAQDLARLVLSQRYIEHDTWHLYSSLMKSAKTYYDFTPSVPQAVERTSQHLGQGLSFGEPTNASTLVQPIVGIATRIHGLLKTIDRELWQKLEALAVEPQLYAIRWLRLLFSREFPIKETMTLWDGLFAEDPSLRLMEYVCVSMLLRIREALLRADYSDTLQLLLRYPAPSDGDHRIPHLMQQAVYLRDHSSAEAGQRCRVQNHLRGAIAGAELVGTGLDTAPRRPSSAASGSSGHRRFASMSPTPAPQGFLGDGGLVGDLAKGAYARAEALGINKALLGTFNEIKKGYAQAQAQAAAAQAARERERERLSQIPSRPESNQPAPAAKDYLAEIGSMRATSLAMSQAVDMCIKALQQDVLGVDQEETGRASAPSDRTMTALTALSHVRDVMSGKARMFDPSVLAPLNEALRPRVPAQHSRGTAGLVAEEELIDTSIPKDSVPLAHTPSSEPSNSSPSFASQAPPTPPLLLSARSDKPLPALTRVPQSAVKPSSSASAAVIRPPVPPNVPRPTAKTPKSNAPPNAADEMTEQWNRVPLTGPESVTRVLGQSNVIDPLGVL